MSDRKVVVKLVCAVERVELVAEEGAAGVAAVLGEVEVGSSELGIGRLDQQPEDVEEEGKVVGSGTRGRQDGVMQLKNLKAQTKQRRHVVVV